MTENFKTFLDYYVSKELNLTESPVRLGRSYGEDLDNDWFNVESAKEKMKDHPLKDISKSNILDTDLYLHRDDYSVSKFQDFWIIGQPFIACYFIFEELQDNGLQSLGVWNHRKYKGTAIDLFFSYYLKKFDYIISDGKHSDQGENYWKKIIKTATENGNRINVIARNNEEYDIDDVESYWGNTPEFSNYRIKIKK